jgi:hypothetical protein
MVAYSLTKKLGQWVQRQQKKLTTMTDNPQKQSSIFEEVMKDYLSKLSFLLDQVEGETLYKEEGALGLA